MKKLVPFLVVVWILIGLTSFFIWWKITRNLTAKTLSDHANKIAKELEVPWELKFKKIIPAYGADFRVIFEGIEAVATDGVTIVEAKRAEVRLPWTILFSKNPVRVNVAFNEVKVTEWSRILSEIETFLDQRKTDRVQEISLSRQIVASAVNLRLNNVEGNWKGTAVKLNKLYLLNMDPKKPTAFEVVFPWQQEWKGAKLSGETKILGEYRFSSQKIDLHYYLKSRIQTQRENRTRSGDVSVEGKGFYHPRMGLFTTLSAKDDWLAFVGDAEWTSKDFKLNVPKFAISKDFILELMPFTGLHGSSSPYQSTGLLGELRLSSSAEAKTFTLKARNKTNSRLNQPDVADRLFNFEADISHPTKAMISFKLGETVMFSVQPTKEQNLVEWNAELFAPPTVATWYRPHQEIWDLLWWIPGTVSEIKSGDAPSYRYEKTSTGMRLSTFVPGESWPGVNVVYDYGAEAPREWIVNFEQKSLEDMILGMSLENFLVPGHPYTGTIYVKSPTESSYKLAWKGGGIALLSRSSCKVSMDEKPELKNFLANRLAHQAEFELVKGVYTIKNWKAKLGSETWTVSGEWSNSPIKCRLQLKQTINRKQNDFSVDII